MPAKGILSYHRLVVLDLAGMGFGDPALAEVFDVPPQ
jgi:hypothetical protein